MNNISIIQSKYYISSKTDLNGVITDVSDAFCKISGYSFNELIGKKHNIVRHEDISSIFFKKMWETIKNGKTWSGVVKNKAKNGDAYYVDTVIEPIIEDGKIVGFLSVRFDISNSYLLEKKNIELKSNLKRFNTLFKSINIGILLVDKKGLIQNVNPYLYNLLGFNKDEMLNKNCIDFFILENSIKIETELKSILKKETEKFKINRQIICKNNNKVWFEVTFSFFDGREVLISLRNIEAYKKLENTSKILLQQSKDAAMGEMLAMISHQWRQPLATICAILSKANTHRQLELYDEDKLDKDFSKISNIIKHLSKTIEFFRNYFKPKNNQVETIQNILESLNTIVEPLIEKNDIQINYILNKTNKLKINCQIEQVLLNIIKNSIDAYVQNNLVGSIDIELSLEDEYLKIKMSDYAGGISENLISRIFEPYFSTKSKNGTGLGLYLSKNIVEDILAGKIYFSNIDNGVCFVLTIPLSKEGEK